MTVGHFWSVGLLRRPGETIVKIQHEGGRGDDVFSTVAQLRRGVPEGAGSRGEIFALPDSLFLMHF